MSECRPSSAVFTRFRMLKFQQLHFTTGETLKSLEITIEQPVMAPPRVPKSQRTSLARSHISQDEELSQPGSQSSDDNHVTKLATEMQREVLRVQA